MTLTARGLSRALLFAAGALLLLLAAAVLIVSRMDQDRLLAAATGRLSRSLDRPVAAGGLQISLPEGEFVVRGLQVGREPLDVGPAPPVLSVDEVRGDLGLWSLVVGRLHFEHLAVDGLSVRGLDDPASASPVSGESGFGFEALATRLSFSSNRIAVSGTTIGYRDGVTPWEIRADGVAVDLRPTGEGGVDGEVGSGRVVIRVREQPGFPLELAAAFRIRGRRFHLDRLELQSDLVEAAVDGSLELADGAAGSFRLTASADAGGLARSLLDFEGIDTRGDPPLRLDATVAFREAGLAVDGGFALPGVRVYGVPLRGFEGSVHWDPERLEVSSEGVLAGGAANLRLLQPWPAGGEPAEVALTVRDTSLAQAVEGFFGTATTLRSRVGIEADLRLPLGDPLLLSGTLSATGVRPEEAGPGELPLGFEATVSLDEEAVAVPRLAVEGAAFRGVLEGRYPRAGNADFVVSAIAGESAGVDALQQEVRRVVFGEDPEAALWDVSGACRFEGTIQGRWPDLVIAGTVEGQTMRLSTIHAETLHAEVRVDPDSMRLDRLAARAGEGRLSASGAFDFGPGEFPDLEFDAAWDAWDIREIIDFLAWDLEAEGLVSGRSRTVRRGERYTGGGTVAGSRGTFLEQPFDELSIAWDLDGETVRLAPMTAAFRGGHAEGALAIGLVDGTMEGSLTGRDYPLAPGLELEWVALRTDFRADIGGDILAPELVFEGTVPALALVDVPLGPASIRASVAGERFEASGALDAGTASFNIAGTLEADAAGTVVLRELDVAPLLVEQAGEREVSIVVSATGDFRIDDPLDEWMEGAAVLESVRIAAPDFVAESGGPTRIVMEDGAVRVEGFRLRHAEGELEAGGSIELDEERLDLTLRGQSSLRAAEPFVPGLTADGGLALEIAVAGSTSEPEVFGTGTIRDGSFRMEGFPHGLSEVNGSVNFDQRSLRIDEVRGRVASGEVVVSGSVLMDGAELGASDLRVQVADARLRYPEDFSATVDADLRLVGDRGGRLLAGEVRIDGALWSREYELSTDVLAAADTIAVSEGTEAGGLLDELLMDVRIETVSPFAVRNSIVNLDADAAIGLQGTAASPAVVGRADLVEGDLYVGAHRFEIVSGRAEFIDPTSIEPVFDVAAEANIRNYRVRLAASGTMEEIEANLTSEPPLRQTDILQLLSGVPEQNLLMARTDDPVAAVSATNLLSQQFSGIIGQRAGRVFGIDRVTVDPFLIGRFSNPTARVTLSKQLTPELNVRYSSSLADADEAIVVVEYARGRVTWILSRDEYGSLGVDFRFRRTY